MRYINELGFIVDQDECPFGFKEYSEEIENKAKAKQTIIGKYTIEEQLNVMRQAIIAIAKATPGFKDDELFNMHRFINEALGRTDEEDVESKKQAKK